MDERALSEFLEAVAAGRVPVDAAVARLRQLPFADLGMARVDHHRALRQGLPEAVYGPGKTVEQCVAIVGELLAGGDGPVLLTRSSPDQIAAVLAAHPTGAATGHTVVWRPAGPRRGRVVVATAGTADLAVATECAVVLAAHGVVVDRVTDVGVAGLHRLLAALDRFEDVDAVVVAAGMEGALASLLGGIVAAPVVAVPTSVGYGSSFEGVTALLSMLSSCAAGVTVVGIDNGYGAACAVLRLLGRLDRAVASAAVPVTVGEGR